MTTFLHRPLSDKDAASQTPAREVDAQAPVQRTEEHGSFFAGLVLWFVISLPFWGVAIWWFFFR